MLIACLAVGFMVHGASPYAGLAPQQAVWILQEYLLIVAILGIGGAVLMREITNQKLRLHLLDRAIDATSDSIIIADARQPETPIIWTNPGFESLFSYSRAEVTGRNCRFLNGREPHQPGVATAGRAIRDRRACEVILHNFRKNDEPLWIPPMRTRSPAGPGVNSWQIRSKIIWRRIEPSRDSRRVRRPL